MKTHRKFLSGLLVLSLLISTGTVIADKPKNKLDELDICLTTKNPSTPGAFTKIFYLHLSKIPGKIPSTLYAVNGLENGYKASTNPPQTYVNELVGTAVIAAPTEMINAKDNLLIGLTGSASGKQGDTQGLWTMAYNFELNPVTYSGLLIGALEFRPIATGISSLAKPNQSEAINIELVKMDCPTPSKHSKH
jgi:hypothetical protein